MSAIDYSAGTFRLLSESGTSVSTTYDVSEYWILLPHGDSQSVSFKVPEDALDRKNTRLKFRYFTPYTYCSSNKKHFSCNDPRFEFTERASVKHSGGYEITIEVESSDDTTEFTYYYYRRIKLTSGAVAAKESVNMVYNPSRNPDIITFTADDDIFVPGAKLQLWASNHY